MFNQDPDNNIRDINKALFKPGLPLWAKKLTHLRVYDCKAKLLRPAPEVIGYDVDTAIAIRLESAKLFDSQFLCSICHKPLQLVCSQDRGSFYFRHKTEALDCPLIDGKYLPEDVIRAKKFQGNQEGPAHAQMKAILYDLLAQDSRFSEIEIERTVVDIYNERKRPDLKAKFNGQEIIFEIQLSTESLKVIHKRADFYAKHKMMLLWIFHQFTFKQANMTGLDIAGFNRGNILVLNEQAEALSRTTKKLHFDCHWLEYKPNGKTWTISEQNSIVEFSNLKFCPDKCEAYYFDSSLNKEQCITKCNAFASQCFENLLRTNFLKQSLDDKYDNYFGQLAKQTFNISLSSNSGLTRFLCILQSAKCGEPFGYKFTQNIQIFHQLYDSSPQLVFIFLVLSAFYGHKLEPSKRDSVTGVFYKKRLEIIKNLKHEKKYSKFYPDRRFESIFKVLFSDGFLEYSEWAKKWRLF